MTARALRSFVDTSPGRFRHWSVASFAVWNAVIWVSRIRNVVVDDDLGAGAKAAWLVPAVVFLVAAAAAGLAWWRGRSSLLWPLSLLAGLSLLYWLVRLPFALLADHSGAFKAVHTVLAVVSMTLAVAVLRRLVRSGMVPTGAYL